MELKLHNGTQEESYLSVRSVKSTIFLCSKKKYTTQDKVLWSAFKGIAEFKSQFVNLTSGCMPSHLCVKHGWMEHNSFARLFAFSRVSQA